MVFSNLIFLYLFLPLCLAAYFLCRSIPAKNAVLIVFSLIFYAWGEPVYLFLMIAAAAVNWGFGLLIEKRHKRVFLVLALVLDLGCLAVFKYTGFVVENLNALFGASIPVPDHRAAHRHLVLYLPGAFLHGSTSGAGMSRRSGRLQNFCSTSRSSRSSSPADRPLCRRRRADRRAQL